MEAKIKMKQIDAALLQKMLIGGAKRLEANKEYINELNVFPVPDGDTGTNMTMTALAAAKEVGNAAEVTVKEVTRGLSSGSLRGARGNSGVILSQLFRGFYKGVKDQDVLTTETVAVGFKKAVETAYKAVMKPKEGTILTVAKVTAEKAVYCARNTEDFEEFAQVVIKEANEILQKTPEMLPVLKEAGVVDSGGQGLVEFLQGAVDALMGKEVDLSSVEKTAVKPAATASEAPLEEKDIKFGYCTEFIVMTKDRVYGDLNTLLVMMKGIPLAYDKDMQEDKEAVFDAVDTLELCLKTITPMLATMTPLPANMRRAAAKGFINATDCADYLTKKGMPFRDAYKCTGTMVGACIRADKTLEELTLDEFKQYSDLFEADIYDAIDLTHCCEGRTSYGGPTQASVLKQIADVKSKINC